MATAARAILDATSRPDKPEHTQTQLTPALPGRDTRSSH
jgi:hypothetical protein